ncbi:hypothetical protein FRC17_006763, partial [Serendipita sp. 399]
MAWRIKHHKNPYDSQLTMQKVDSLNLSEPQDPEKDVEGGAADDLHHFDERMRIFNRHFAHTGRLQFAEPQQPIIDNKNQPHLPQATNP